MSDYMGDLSTVFGTGGVDYSNTALGKKDRSTLDLDDYLKLMVAMFQNQTMDNTADISDMMNNMVQMSVVQAISSISSLIEESTALNYAASLVGEKVTVGIVNNGQLTEIEGYVAATGTYNGVQVIFLKDKAGNPIEGYVPITSIMTVGWLSDTRMPGGAENPGGSEDPVDPTDPVDPSDPVDPADPDPVDPADPEDSVEREDPVEPEQTPAPSPEELAEEAMEKNGNDTAAEETLT